MIEIRQNPVYMYIVKNLLFSFNTSHIIFTLANPSQHDVYRDVKQESKQNKTWAKLLSLMVTGICNIKRSQKLTQSKQKSRTRNQNRKQPKLTNRPNTINQVRISFPKGGHSAT